MIMEIALVLELMSVIVCIYQISGQKVGIDISTAALFVTLLIVFDYLNALQVSGVYGILIYGIIYVFDKRRFGKSYVGAGIDILLLMIIMPAIQFICLVISAILVPKEEAARTLICNTLVLFVCTYLLPKFKVDRVQKSIAKGWKYARILIVFVLPIIIILLLQDIFFRGIFVGTFVFAIPISLVLLVLLGRWSEAEERIEIMQDDLRVSKSMREKYDKLLEQIRLRQHEFKNHLAAVFSAHYTYHTYEKLVNAQTEYCNKLQHENKYNNLVLIENNILAGFLYGKFQEIEDDGVDIDYYIKASLKKIKVPEYRLIEVIGILLDNALDAVTEYGHKKQIEFSVVETNDRYQFFIKNEYRYMPYDEIEKWFQLHNSTKGRNRGIGLYHVKMICNEWNMNIGCRNVTVDGENWIEFTLDIDKADR